MATKIFLNLPVKNLAAAMAFFQHLGFSFNPQFTDDTTACMVISADIFAMLLTQEKFQSFAPRPISDAKTSTAMLIALSCDSREAVTAMVEKAVAAGGATYAEPKDYGFMLQHGFEDLDGHIWEVFYMDPSAVNQ